ncbi:hypothetical protein HMP0721_0590 [Pseudoramibacter alactolyticus ATCC 23263]|uniref:Uncharacterized protein n=1 Tax=Pseudoramibacter alactolyticus ATCC 23263 TaxID=887929 RepID=E6MF07_9FIRM|nr:hypothetical protein HMP0721_0590 [Pseudoramibacter alactolyticus ATCC 23263]
MYAENHALDARMAFYIMKLYLMIWISHTWFVIRFSRYPVLILTELSVD